MFYEGELKWKHKMQMGLVQASGDREDGTHFTVISDMGFENGRGYPVGPAVINSSEVRPVLFCFIYPP